MNEETCDYLEYRGNIPYCTFTNQHISEESAARCMAVDEMDRDNCLNYCYTPES
jgi:hypothetical protein